MIRRTRRGIPLRISKSHYKATKLSARRNVKVLPRSHEGDEETRRRTGILKPVGNRSAVTIRLPPTSTLLGHPPIGASYTPLRFLPFFVSFVSSWWAFRRGLFSSNFRDHRCMVGGPFKLAHVHMNTARAATRHDFGRDKNVIDAQPAVTLESIHAIVPPRV